MSLMFTFLLLAALGFLALIWLIAEPISGFFGSTILAKVMAIIVAFKLVSYAIGWLMGPATQVIRL